MHSELTCCLLRLAIDLSAERLAAGRGFVQLPHNEHSISVSRASGHLACSKLLQAIVNHLTAARIRAAPCECSLPKLCVAEYRATGAVGSRAAGAVQAHAGPAGRAPGDPVKPG